MSTARHHAEWLSLVEASGPFLSLPVLLQAFPQGLEAHDPDHMRRLKLAYEEWQDNQQGARPDPAIHRAWVEFVLSETLELPEDVLLSGQSIPAGLQVTITEQGETLRPDWVVVDPHPSPLPGGEGTGSDLPSPLGRGAGGEGSGGRKPRLLIQLYHAGQALEKSVKGSRWAASPATRMMELLHACEVRLGLITNGDQWMLVNAPRGETTGYISWYATLWQEENVTLRAFRSLLGVERFFNVPDEETLEALLAQSVNSQQEVTDQLGYQVRKAVEVLVQSIDRIDQDRNGDLLRGVSETRLYEAALTVMMRLVFLFFAEENQLIPPQETEFYDTFYAVTTLREQLREQADQNGEEILERKHDAWCRLLATFRAVHGGVQHDALYIPAYGGSLFNPDRFPFLEGRPEDTRWLDLAAEPIAVNNRTVLHLLEALQVLQVRVPGGGVESRKLSFRALDIEQIGHVYEGLLDHTAVRATEPILGLEGSKAKEPEVSLTALEQHWHKGEAALVEFLAKETGKSKLALQKKIPGSSGRIAGLDGQKETGRRPIPQEENTAEACGIAVPAVQDAREGTGRRPIPQEKNTAASCGIAVPAVPNTQGNKLLIACQNDQALFKRVLPWIGLIRLDTFDYPTVIPAGSVFVTQGSDRRETGTHYTPRSLTEEIVKYTLEPLVYEGVAEGKPKEEWRLKSAPELLALKICDMAMGSGAFLVQVCRYLSERLVESWEAEEGSCGIAILAVPNSTQGTGQRPIPQDIQEAGQRPILRILPDGSLSAAEPGEAILPNDPDERLAVARRIVADRCLYGVDKNPMAVEMAKLSLWLITLQKNRPFTFLDHALRCGDSLLGVTSREQIEFLNLNPDNEAVQLRTVSEIWRPLLAQAIAKRKELESFTVNDIQDLARKEALQAEAEELTSNIKIAADYLIGEALAQAGKTGNLKVEDLGVLSGLVTDALEEPDEQQRETKLRQIREKAQRMLNAGKPEGQPPREPFHWALEFPEVFLEEGAPRGFSAIVGNPPFITGSNLTGTFGTDYREYLVEEIAHSKRGNADICTYFFLLGVSLLFCGGNLGFLATNTIAQGDTREVGLEQILRDGTIIYRAVQSRKWPGEASLEVSHVWINTNAWKASYILDDKKVTGITSLLTEPGKAKGNPHKLVANSGKSFNGSKIYGKGFVLTSEEVEKLIRENSKNKDVIYPYLGGEDLNSRPDQTPGKWVINFFDWPLSEEQDDPKNPKGEPFAVNYLDCLKIVEHKVKPDREKLRDTSDGQRLKEYWWQYGRNRPELHAAMKNKERVLVISSITKYLVFSFSGSRLVFDHNLTVLTLDNWFDYAVIQSSVHVIWAEKYSSTLETRLGYRPSDCFETFPFPDRTDTLETIGETYYTHRQTIMQTRQEGLTKTYNRFHDPTCTDPDIQTLRHLHIQMDNAVTAAYGWHDLISPPSPALGEGGRGGEGLNHDFHDTKQGLRFTISEAARREVLDRLLALNHQRYAEEVAQGLHDKKKGKGKNSKGKSKKAKSNPAPAADPSGKYTTQGTLFGDDTPTQGELF